MPSTESKSKQHPAWMDMLFPIAFFLAGVGLLVFGSQELSSGYSSKDWKTTQGVVIESRVVDKGHSSKSKGKNCKPAIVYSYSVDQNTFTSDRILFGMATFTTIFKSGSERSREWVSKYPEGAAVAVAFNPSEPSQSTLNTGAHITAWIAPVMGVAFLSAGLFLFRSSKKEKSR